MKTETKKFDQSNWDWFAYLDADETTKEKYHHEATNKSGSWVTCACGQLCKDLPRTPHDSPEDITLDHLGIEFDLAIKSLRWNDAKYILHQIEARTAVLLDEMKQETLSSFGKVDTISTKSRIFKVSTFDGETFMCNLEHIKLENLEQIKRLYHMWDFEWEPFAKIDLKEMIEVNNQ